MQIIIFKSGTFNVCVPIGNNDMFSTVALNSSTLALIGADPLVNGLISTCSLFSLSSSINYIKFSIFKIIIIIVNELPESEEE